MASAYDLEPGTLAQDGPVPFHAEGFEIGQDLVGRAGARAWRVEVLDADQPLTRMRARIEVAADGGNQGTEMQGTAGGRRKAPAVGSHAGARKGRKARKARKARKRPTSPAGRERQRTDQR